MPDDFSISLIVPTRRRPEQLQRLLDSIAQTVSRPETVEVVLVIDADDPESLNVSVAGLTIRRVVVQPGLPMGTLNQTGYQAASGRYLMLLNDDMIARTDGWDITVANCFRLYPDEILLLHVNDLVLQKALCAFPILSRKFCERVGGVCPPHYRRYRIDDHIEDYFNMLAFLGERRTLFMPEVVFEHFNFVLHENGTRLYYSEPDTLEVDARAFAQEFAARKETALALLAHLRPWVSEREKTFWRVRLDSVADSFDLRTTDRQRILTSAGVRDPWELTARRPLWARARDCFRQQGVPGLARALVRKLARPRSTSEVE